MKNKLLIAAFALLSTPFLSFAQVDIVPWGGYNFGARMGIYGGELRMRGNGTFGVNVDFHLDEETAVQFSYSNTLTYININDYYYPGGGITNGTFSDVSANYFLLGGQRYFGYDNIQPYGTFNLGMAYYKFTNFDDYYQQLGQSDAYRFAIGFGLGAKVMMSERIGIDLHIRALAPIQWGGVGVGIGTGGASAGVYAGSSFISGDVGGGLIFRLGDL